MTNERAVEILNLDLDILGQHGGETAEAYKMAIKALEQKDVLEKIRAEIQRLRNCSCSCSDGIIDDVEDIIDKYKVESEDAE